MTQQLPAHSRHSSRRAHLSRRPICIAVAMALALAGAGAGTSSQVQAVDAVDPMAGNTRLDELLTRARTDPSSAVGRLLADPRSAALVARWQARSERPRGGGHPVIQVDNCNDSGPGSLRAALAQLTTAGEIDLTGLSCSRITLTSGALSLPRDTDNQGLDLEIVGPGRDRLIIDGNDQAPVFSGAKYSNLFLSGVTVAHGRNVGSQFATGGCIALPAGALYMVDTRIRDCHVQGGELAMGGGVSAAYVMGKYAEITGNTVTGNGIVSGGGVASKYQAVLAASTISGNSVHMGAADPDQARSLGGGGMASKYSLGIIASTVSGNTVFAESGNIGGGGLLGPSVKGYYSQITNNSAVTLEGISVGGGLRAYPPPQPSSPPIAIDELSSLPGLAGVDSLDNPRAQARRAAWRSSHISGATAGRQDRGIYYAFAQLRVSHSQVSGNSAGFGGGVGMHDHLDRDVGDMIIANSTISANVATAAGQGGGLAVSSGLMTVTDATVAFNEGGGIWLDVANGPFHDLVMQSSIAAGNSGGDIAVSDALSVDGDYNLVRSWNPALLTLPADTLTADPLLQPLALNGSWHSSTHALAPGSPAIDAGPESPPPFNTPSAVSRGGSDSDQRGSPFLRYYGAAQDIGAYEYNDLLFYHGFQSLMNF